MNDSYLKVIKDKTIKKFTEESLNKYGDALKFDNANKVAEIVYKKFISMGYVTKDAQQKFVDMTLCAAFLYNLFLDKDDITTLFMHRIKLNKIASASGLDERDAVLIYELIESQYGDNHPIQRLKPTPNTPGYTLAEAIWYVETFPKLQRMVMLR